MSIDTICMLAVVVGWMLVYILSLVSICKYRDQIVPPYAIAMNFPWELLAALYTRQLLFIAPLTLDLFMFIFCIAKFKKQKSQKYLGKFLIIFTITLVLTFLAFQFTYSGWIETSFIIDLIMAIEYLNLPNAYKASKLIVLISAFARLIGDAGAWICNMHDLIVANVCGVIVFILNSIYCVLIWIGYDFSLVEFTKKWVPFTHKRFHKKAKR